MHRTRIPSPRRGALCPAALACAALCLSAGAAGAVPEVDLDTLLDLPLENLLSMEVSSVSRRLQDLKDAPAAVYVLTGEEIRRMGVNSLPDALRMVPGLHVAQISSNQWTVAVRGFSNRFTNKLLVLIDGRSIYRHSFSGVYWDEHDIPLTDIERIEIIRGPGATLWGANAVNGVINVITRDTADTLGGVAQVGTGTHERANGEVRYGASLADDVDGRIWARYAKRGSLDLAQLPLSSNDDWQSARAGFRLDGTRSTADTWSLQGDMYRNHSNQRDAVELPAGEHPYDSGGWFLMGSWTRELGADSAWTLQAYVDRNVRDEHVLREEHLTVDVDFQHRSSPLADHDVIWGAGYRRIEDEYGNTQRVVLNPASDTYRVFSAFVQDEVSLVPEALRVVVGSKFEHNAYTGFEYQPNLRAIWQPQEEHALWGSVARAVRTPSRFERDALVPQGPTSFLFGNPDLSSETVIAKEVGYRYTPVGGGITLDLALFHNAYDNIFSLEPTQPFPSTVFANKVGGTSRGAELALDWAPDDADWRVRTSYTWLQIDLATEPGSLDTSTVAAKNGGDPEHQFKVHLSADLRPDILLDLMLEYASEKPVVGQITLGQAVRVADYLNLGFRLAWRLAPDVELSVSGRNLLQDSHVETAGEAFTPQATVDRSFAAHLRWDWR